MREIKFRYLLDSGWVYYTLDEIESDETVGADILNKKYKARNQFTGLLDKNGKEICEGDILKGTSCLYGYYIKDGKQFDYLGVVEWGEQCDIGLCWLLRHPDSGFWELKQTVHHSEIDYCTGEIIGNIYENPELIEVSK